MAALAAFFSAWAWHSAAAAKPVTWIVLDASNGEILGQQGADLPNYPASLTKMMTLYLAFEALERGYIVLDQEFRVSAHAARQAPSKLGLRPGQSITVRDLILAMVTKSANDAAVTMAEGLAGSEAAFAILMTRKARSLGLSNTVFRNASGLPNPGQYTTARDLARLAYSLYRDYPREYAFFGTQSFSYQGQTFETHNHLMEEFQGMDGIKTGFINASGFNLAASAVRNHRRLIGVIMGGRTAESRDMQMAELLDDAFALRMDPPPAMVASAEKITESAGRVVAQTLSPIATANAATPADTASEQGDASPHSASMHRVRHHRIQLAEATRSSSSRHAAHRHGKRVLAAAHRIHHGKPHFARAAWVTHASACRAAHHHCPANHHERHIA